MAKFSIDDLLNAQSKPMEAQGAALVIEQIPIGKLVQSADNFYGIRDVDELAVSIESIGLKHNLVVKAANAQGLYEIISGARRHIACLKLYEAGNQAYATLPCKVERVVGDGVLDKLALIMTNSTARELTDWEKVRQTQEIKECLRQLKREGNTIEGRLREAIAEKLNVSSSQVQRMERIAKYLLPEWDERFKAGEIGITQAYELSTLPPEEQARAAHRGNSATPEQSTPDTPRQPSEKAAKKSAQPDRQEQLIRLLEQCGVRLLTQQGMPRAPGAIGREVLEATGMYGRVQGAEKK